MRETKLFVEGVPLSRLRERVGVRACGNTLTLSLSLKGEGNAVKYTVSGVRLTSMLKRK